jgi:hypothetical protein
MICERGVAIFAGIIDAAALHLDRNNVSWPVIMFAPGPRIKVDASHISKIHEHCDTEESLSSNQS